MSIGSLTDLGSSFCSVIYLFIFFAGRCWESHLPYQALVTSPIRMGVIKAPLSSFCEDFNKK